MSSLAPNKRSVARLGAHRPHGLRGRFVIQCFLITSLGLVGISCASQPNSFADAQPTKLSAVIANPALYDSKVVTVEGELKQDTLGHEYLFQRGSSITLEVRAAFVDFVRLPTAPPAEKSTTPCIVVRGKFTRYSSETVGGGYLISEVGVLDADSVTPCR